MYVLKSKSHTISLSVLFQASLQQPKTVLEALQQRLEKYKSAAAQAKASGDDRKGRMHERIAKVNESVAGCLHPAKPLELVYFLHPAKPFELVLLLKTFSGLQ